MAWEHGSAQVQALGGMLGPLRLRLSPLQTLEVLHVAPWAEQPGTESLPGLMQKLRGEWPCVPFGRTDLPHGLPRGWSAMEPSDHWDHGYAANHAWRCIESRPERLHLAIDYPGEAPIERVERIIEADPHTPALNISLSVWARRETRMPTGLHPTFRIPAAPGRVRLELGPHQGIFSYPTNDDTALAQLQANVRSTSLERMAGVDGALDLSHLPLARPNEDLVQVRAPLPLGEAPPLTLHYLDEQACVGLWWDTDQLPDLMLWISNRGRSHFPWLGRHTALGAEPVNSLFDLGRVCSAPPDHPLADRKGIALKAGQAWTTRYRIAAWQNRPVQIR